MANSKGVKKEHTNHKHSAKQYAKKQAAIAKLNQEIPAKLRLMINRWFKRFDKVETEKRIVIFKRFATNAEIVWLDRNMSRLEINQIIATNKRNQK